jgi:hypothetical protein
MNRRELLVLAGGAMAPLALHAEQKTEPVIGLLNATSSAALAPYLEAFRLGLLEPAMSKEEMSSSSTAMRSSETKGCPHWPPILSAATST